MADELNKKEDAKLEFTPDGEVPGYISLDQATVLAIRIAREDTSVYDEEFANRELVWLVERAEESEDYYRIFIGYRPLRKFKGESGVEQFTIDKLGNIDSRLILSIPRRRRDARTWVSAVGALILIPVTIGALFITGIFSPRTELGSAGTAVGTAPPNLEIDPLVETLVLLTPTIPLTAGPETQDIPPKRLELNRGSSDAENSWYLQGKALQANGEHVLAIIQFTLSIDNLPKFLPAYEARSTSYWETGDPRSSLKDITRAIDLAPSADRYYQRGQRYQLLRDHPKAIGDYSLAIQLVQVNPTYFVSRATSHKEIGGVEEAIRDFTHAIELDPIANAHWYIWRGEAYEEIGNPVSAQVDFSQACKLDTTYCWATKP